MGSGHPWGVGHCPAAAAGAWLPQLRLGIQINLSCPVLSCPPPRLIELPGIYLLTSSLNTDFTGEGEVHLVLMLDLLPVRNHFIYVNVISSRLILKFMYSFSMSKYVVTVYIHIGLYAPSVHSCENIGQSDKISSKLKCLLRDCSFTLFQFFIENQDDISCMM